MAGALELPPASPAELTCRVPTVFGGQDFKVAWKVHVALPKVRWVIMSGCVGEKQHFMFV